MTHPRTARDVSVSHADGQSPPFSPRQTLDGDVQRKVDELDKLADESELLSKLSADSEARIYNAALAKELRAKAVRLRAENLKTKPGSQGL